jgi:hypothetical protein
VTVYDTTETYPSIQNNIAITEPLSVSYSTTNVAVYGASTGAIDVTVAGGTGSYTYTWTDSSVTTQDRSNLPAGTYSVTIDSGTYQSIQSNITITEPLSVSYSTTNVTVYGASTGAIDVTVAGGTGSYTYTWTDNGSASLVTTQDRSSLAGGTYSVTIDSGTYQSIQSNITITEPLSVSYSTTNVGVYGASTGAIDVTVAGGTGSYSYTWTDSSVTTQDRSNLPAGTYSVTIDSGTYQSIQSDITITEPLNVTYSTTDVTVYGESTGTIDITVAGGTGSYSYTWTDDGTVTTQDRSNLPAGTYTVTVNDTTGTYPAVQSDIIITEGLYVTYSTTDVSTYGGSTGSITLTVVGGTGSYSYLWSDKATTKNRTYVSSRQYSVTITSGTHTYTEQIYVSQPLHVTISSTNVTYGQTNGSITLAVAGGNGSYSYTWTDDGSVTSISTQNRTDLSAGTYSVTITSGDYSETQSVTLTEIYPLTITYVLTTCSSTYATDGAIDISVTGGYEAYSYKWSDDSSINSPNRSNLSTGVYSVTVTSGTYTTNKSITVTEPILNIFNPVHYMYLNPELDGTITTVEDALTHYTTTGEPENLQYINNTPSDFNYQIFYQNYSTAIIEWGSQFLDSSVMNELLSNDIERLCIVYYNRFSSTSTQYSVSVDFKDDIYKTYNEVSRDYLSESELYLDYLKGRAASSNVLGTIDDFMLSSYNSVYASGTPVNYDVSIIGSASIKCNLYVGSNITTPLLDVIGIATLNGDVNANSNLLVSGTAIIDNSLYVSNSVQATEFISASDERIKTNIHEMSFKAAREIVENLKIKSYEIEGVDHTRRCGVVAQDLLMLEQLQPFLKKTKVVMKVNKESVWDEEKECHTLKCNRFCLSDTLIINNQSYKVNAILNEDDFQLIPLLPSNLLVTERHIDDFLSVNYPELLNSSIVCIQELLRRREKISAFLQKKCN